MKNKLKIFGVMTTLILVAPASAVMRVVMDFDGTVVADKGPEAAWVTPWVLYRVNDLRNLAQSASNKPIKILIRKPDESLVNTMIEAPSTMEVS